MVSMKMSDVQRNDACSRALTVMCRSHWMPCSAMRMIMYAKYMQEKTVMLNIIKCYISTLPWLIFHSLRQLNFDN